MSKRMNRVAVSVLISLLIVAGIYTTVFGASLHTGISRGSVRVNAGLMLDVSHVRTETKSLNTYYSNVDHTANFHDCSSGDSGLDPND